MILDHLGTHCPHRPLAAAWTKWMSSSLLGTGCVKSNGNWAKESDVYITLRSDRLQLGDLDSVTKSRGSLIAQCINNGSNGQEALASSS